MDTKVDTIYKVLGSNQKHSKRHYSTMIRLDDLLISGNENEKLKNMNANEIIQYFGEPELLEPERKSYPMMLVYGNLEFRIKNNKLGFLGFNLPSEKDNNYPIEFGLGIFKSEENRKFKAIEEQLSIENVFWKKDIVMSDEYQQNYVTNRNSHLVFHQKILARVGIDFG